MARTWLSVTVELLGGRGDELSGAGVGPGGSWLHVDCLGSRDGWRDMADFARRQRSAELREGLVQAIEGRGAFRRFRDVIHEEDLAGSWSVFSADRWAGRARRWLADEGVRVR